jgi:acetyltransferase-like isoleucine patch superfamily enzyme
LTIRWDNRSLVSSLSPSDLAPNLLLGSGVTIAEGVSIGANVVVYDDVRVEVGARLDDGAVLGRLAYRNRQSRTPPAPPGPTVVETDATVSPYALVSAGVRMGPGSFLGDHAHMREGVVLGAEAMVGSGCGIGRYVEIGDRARLQTQSLVGQRVVIEPDCFLGPGVYVLTGRKMTTAERAAPPRLRRGCQIGAGARILPGVEIGEEAVVGAGAVVTLDVPAGAVVRGIPARLAADRDDSPPSGSGVGYDPVG